VLTRGPNETAKLALFKATAGIWDKGEGLISRPAPDQIFFLPERSYLPPGTLREVLLPTEEELALPDERIIGALRDLGLEGVLTRVGGLDVERDWDDMLSLGEQHLIAIARLLLIAPRFVFLDRIATALEGAERDRVLRLLTDASITYIAFARSEEPLEFYDGVLELKVDGSWTWTVLRE
jgi:putative ATP-binding cassette transporter